MGFWDGSGSALIGSGFSSLVAVFAVLWTRKTEREDRREDASRAAASECLALLQKMASEGDQFLQFPDEWPQVRFTADRVASFAALCRQWEQEIFHYSVVVRPKRLSYMLGSLWEDLLNHYSPGFTREMDSGNVGALDQLAREFGQETTNLQDELQAYLRSGWDPRPPRSVTIWTMRFATRWPYVKRVRGRFAEFEKELRKRDHAPKADY